MQNYDYDDAKKSCDFILQKLNVKPETAIILGSGLGDAAEILDEKIIIDSKSIPIWPVSTAPGHAGKIISGKIFGRNVIILQGRVHFYEGYSMKAVTFPVRVLGMMGVHEYIATNASGAINEDFKSGEIIAVSDHINLMGTNPLIGENESRWNERFPDMTHAYSTRFLKIFENLGLRKGIYAAFSGPSFETPAEIRMARILGADLAGMSTVPEIIVANSMGMETAVLSCVANKAAGISEEILNGEEVLKMMSGTAKSLIKIIKEFIKILNSDLNSEGKIK